MLTAVIALSITALFLGVLTLLLGVRLWIEIDATDTADCRSRVLAHRAGYYEAKRAYTDAESVRGIVRDVLDAIAGDTARPVVGVELPPVGVDLGKPDAP